MIDLPIIAQNGQCLETPHPKNFDLHSSQISFTGIAISLIRLMIVPLFSPMDINPVMIGHLVLCGNLL